MLLTIEIKNEFWLTSSPVRNPSLAFRRAIDHKSNLQCFPGHKLNKKAFNHQTSLSNIEDHKHFVLFRIVVDLQIRVGDGLDLRALRVLRDVERLPVPHCFDLEVHLVERGDPHYL